MPFPPEAASLIEAGAPFPLQDHEILIEGYVLGSKSGRPIQSVAVYPGAMNQESETIPGALAVTDSNGFFSIIVDRDRYTHLAAACLAPSQRGDEPGQTIAVGLVVLPTAVVSQAERTIRLDVPRRFHLCGFPIESSGGLVTQ